MESLDELLNGIILINKPAGISSFGVVNKVRYYLSKKIGHRVKVGHTGTLDPFAEGLMILVTGSYCKKAGEFSKLDKSYEAIVQLGMVSTTGDPEGELTKKNDREITKEEVLRTLKKLTGDILQTPPAFSAIKINGRRAYDMARAGEVVVIPPRKVHIERLELLTYDYPLLTLNCDVSSGTYIRVLAEDIGEMLGVGAYTMKLKRTRVGEYRLSDSRVKTLQDFVL